MIEIMKKVFTKHECEVINFAKDYRKYEGFKPIVVTLFKGYPDDYYRFHTIGFVKDMVKRNPHFFDGAIETNIFALL